ncbi:hypothetical protein GCM10023322_34460 [Rugosimonospora acidiphila]|uniref:Uncharacterized protein n=1 Tax=Rugosimonospora acidiphila TaxID=556531 RepID=A0ABP9RTR1_9ACTN
MGRLIALIITRRPRRRLANHAPRVPEGDYRTGGRRARRLGHTSAATRHAAGTTTTAGANVTGWLSTVIAGVALVVSLATALDTYLRQRRASPP